MMSRYVFKIAGAVLVSLAVSGCGLIFGGRDSITGNTEPPTPPSDFDLTQTTPYLRAGSVNTSSGAVIGEFSKNENSHGIGEFSYRLFSFSNTDNGKFEVDNTTNPARLKFKSSSITAGDYQVVVTARDTGGEEFEFDKEFHIIVLPQLTVLSATLEDATPDKLNVTFSEPVKIPSPAGFSFRSGTLAINSTAAPVAIAPAGDGRSATWQLTLSSPATVNSAATISYNDTAGTVYAMDENDKLASFSSGMPVTNNIILLTIKSAALENAAPNKLDVIFSKPVKMTNFSGFTLSGYNISAMAAVSVDADGYSATWQLTLNSSATFATAATIAYDGSGTVVGVNGAGMDSVAALSVSNNITPAAAGVYDSSGLLVSSYTTFAAAITYLNTAAVGTYTIAIDDDEPVSTQQTLSPANIVTVVLKGVGSTPSTLTFNYTGTPLSYSGYLTVRSKATLVLGKNITLKGTSSNKAPLVYLYGSGSGDNAATLIMRQGSTITGNSNSSTAFYQAGGGVKIDDYGHFFMQGGVIRDNTAYQGGGVNSTYASSAVFKKTGGIIYGDTNTVHTPNSDTNTATASSAYNSGGHAVYFGISGSIKHRDTTAGETVDLDNTIAANWE